MRGRKTGVRAVATYTFPAEIFLIEGDPEAVRESGRSYGRFAGIAAEAAAGLRGLDSGTWVGTEGDLFRAQVAGISPHLDIACAAFAQVVGALGGFAEVLAGAQHQMAGVRVDAEQIFGSLTEARAEQAGLREPTDGEVAVAPPVAAAFQERRAALGGRIASSGRPGGPPRPPARTGSRTAGTRPGAGLPGSWTTSRTSWPSTPRCSAA
jgi:hypothetical protein